MQASIRVRGDDFTYDLFNKLKTLVEGKDVIIKIEVEEGMNDTDYLMRSPENHRQLIEAIDRLKNNEGIVTVPMENI